MNDVEKMDDCTVRINKETYKDWRNKFGWG